jgi:hypothetical protein
VVYDKSKMEASSLLHEYIMEHLIEDSDGNLKPLRPGDLSINNYRGVREAFRMLYGWLKRKDLKSLLNQLLMVLI